MRLVVVSGLSGSGKSIALNMLEDLGYYCVDNIPAGLLPGLIDYTVRSHQPDYELTAVGLDARNRPEDLADVPRELAKDGDRILPGDGDIPLASIIAHLRRIDYQGCVSLELMNPQLWQVSPLQLATTGLASINRLLTADG